MLRRSVVHSPGRAIGRGGFSFGKHDIASYSCKWCTADRQSELLAPMIRCMEFAENRPRWRQVYAVVVGRICSGEYAPGRRVPSVVQLTEEFGIANVTAQKVMRALREGGYITTEPGMGSFVVDELPEKPEG